MVGNTGISLWDGGESGLEHRRLGRGQGCKDLDGHQGREVRTQRPSFSFSFLIAITPHTVAYCLSCNLFKRR
ncbi:LOW QUALITY PROTEIN: putative cancer susceptibility gene HEPN1 protein [Vulpes vulpes]|uniref:LOW QUALITY PROTEIN: putative cancer susceptibility gene HEPN1 protein n=1 Tax=Vulpes vulpes TaxID=9627 RepID=A0ABM4Y5J5_VULVU